MPEDTTCAAVIFIRNVILLNKSSLYWILCSNFSGRNKRKFVGGFKVLCDIHVFFNNVVIEKLNNLHPTYALKLPISEQTFSCALLVSQVYATNEIPFNLTVIFHSKSVQIFRNFKL